MTTKLNFNVIDYNHCLCVLTICLSVVLFVDMAQKTQKYIHAGEVYRILILCALQVN